MKPNKTLVSDPTDETEPAEIGESELFADLAPREPRSASGLQRRPRASLANVARLGALVSPAGTRTSIPAPASTRDSVSLPSLPARPPPARTSSAPPAVVPGAPAGRSRLGAVPASESQSVPAPGATPALGTRARAALALAAGGSMLAVLAIVLARGTGGAGSLVVTVTGPGSSEVAGLEVLLDGEQRCSASPCRIGSLEPGTHLVSVRARGFDPTAALAVTVGSRTESVFNVALSRSAPVLPAAARPVMDQPRAAAASLDVPNAATSSETIPSAGEAAAVARSSKPMTAPAPRGKGIAAPRAPAEPASGTDPEKSSLATLRIVSRPVANILVDGRPIGHTPQVVRVSPGTHRVAIVSGEERRAQTVTVLPGASQVVSVQF